jgi:hypothetical protein
MLDMKQAGELVTQLQQVENRTHQPVDPSLPLELARARRDIDTAFDNAWARSAAEEGLVWAGLNAVARWVKGDR